MPAAGVPDSVPVPFPLLLNVTPVGSAPVTASEGVGNPVDVIPNDPAALAENDVEFALVIAGACWTARVNACCVDAAPFDAVKVRA